MNPTAAIAIFDIGKTNKKLFVFDEDYNILLEKSMQFTEVPDEDGDMGEDLEALTQWVSQSINELAETKIIAVKALNFSTYGASLVHVDKEGRPVAPLYNYLKPFPERLQHKFYPAYGGEVVFSLHTASPLLGNLNAGLQLYYLKEEKPDVFSRVSHSLHLPQYMSYLVTKRLYSDITSIGCHTALWNFTENHYHEWIFAEGVNKKLAPIFPSDQLMNARFNGKPFLCGAGLHDSSAALIPYLFGFTEPFVLVSTGTWCITLNPFNQTALTPVELQQDCLCYMEYRGKPIKASRLFAGYEHEQQVKRLAAHFNVASEYYKNIVFDAFIVQKCNAPATNGNAQAGNSMMQASAFAGRDLTVFETYSDAYHQLMLDIMVLQAASIKLVLPSAGSKKIFVDGGFGKNPVYMNLLAAAFPGMEVYAASVAQASAIGAALAVHQHWTKKSAPQHLIALKAYTCMEAIEI